MRLTKDQLNKLNSLLQELRDIQDIFLKKFDVNDIYSNSKIFEILIANELNHLLVPGHSGSRDAKDGTGGEFEYKHFKETSGNHSWTFNDYSDTVIEKIRTTKGVIFAHIEDTVFPPRLDWYIYVTGSECADYLKQRTEDLLKRKPKGHVNKRKMINFSALQIERDLNVSKISLNSINESGEYYGWLKRIFNISLKIEELIGVTQILTSNKIWEILVSLKLNHTVLSEQAGHDAIDLEGGLHEYKISKNYAWNFQDISDNVLNKYTKDKSIILAVVNKQKLDVDKIFQAQPQAVVERLKQKLEEKRKRYETKGGLRRLQVSLSKRDLQIINATELNF